MIFKDLPLPGKMLPPFVLILSAAVFLGWPGGASAAKLECNSLIGKARNAGETPKVYYNKSWGIIHVLTSRDECVEPVEIWNRRGLPWKAILLKEGEEPPKPGAAAKPAAKPPPGTAQPATAATPPPGAECTRDLGEFWKPGRHMIRGVSYWLSSVYTFDLNGDGVTDNVGFRLKSKDKPDVVLRYFGASGQLSGKSLPGLDLNDDGMIPRLCFGQLPLTEMAEIEPMESLFKSPDLAKEMEARKAGTYKPEGERSKVVEESGGLPWLAISAGVFTVLALGGVAAFLTRRKWMGKKGDEDEEEDEDEDFDEFE